MKRSGVMNVLGCFEHAFVLNLPEDVMRMTQTEAELEKHDIPFERLPGKSMIGLPNNPFLGNMGCMRSHLSAVKKARERGYENILIMEDDVVLRPNFRDLWEDVIPQLQKLNYDLFYPYQWEQSSPLVNPIQVQRIKGTVCMHFYAVHSQFYDRYIFEGESEFRSADERFKSGIMMKPLDVLFHAPDVRTFATSYNLAGQRAALSNLSFRARRAAQFSAHDKLRRRNRHRTYSPDCSAANPQD